MHMSDKEERKEKGGKTYHFDGLFERCVDLRNTLVDIHFETHNITARIPIIVKGKFMILKVIRNVRRDLRHELFELVVVVRQSFAFALRFKRPDATWDALGLCGWRSGGGCRGSWSGGGSWC